LIDRDAKAGPPSPESQECYTVIGGRISGIECVRKF
jgi:hypothetical protein